MWSVVTIYLVHEFNKNASTAGYWFAAVDEIVTSKESLCAASFCNIPRSLANLPYGNQVHKDKWANVALESKCWCFGRWNPKKQSLFAGVSCILHSSSSTSYIILETFRRQMWLKTWRMSSNKPGTVCCIGVIFTYRGNVRHARVIWNLIPALFFFRFLWETESAMMLYC